MKARSSPVCAWRSSVFRSAPAIKIDFFAEVMITPRSDASFSISVEMLIQVAHCRGVENIRAGFRAISVSVRFLYVPLQIIDEIATTITSPPLSCSK